MSDWNVPRISFDDFLDDLDAVINAMGLQRYALMGVSQGAAIAIAHAARYPERVTRLVLHGAYARGRARRPAAGERETADALLAIRLRAAWDEIDVTHSLVRIRAPTLVTHSRRDGVVPFAEGRSVAAAMPGARFCPLDSDNHILTSDELAWATFVGEIQFFLSTR